VLKAGDKRWVAIWVMIYVMIISLDMFLPHMEMQAVVVKYLGIFLCVVYAASKFKRDTRLIFALLLTLLADALLMLMGALVLGLFVFCFVQFFHTMRLTKIDSRFIVTYGLAVFVVFAAGLLLGMKALYVLAVIYAAGLLFNLRLAWQWRKKEPDSIRASCCWWGFLLFVLCDICVGLWYLGTIGEVSPPVMSIAGVLVFMFYYPSQVLISNSSNLTEV